jgi:hypothetical protein
MTVIIMVPVITVPGIGPEGIVIIPIPGIIIPIPRIVEAVPRIIPAIIRVIMRTPEMVIPPEIVEPPVVGIPGQTVPAPHVPAPVTVPVIMVIVRTAQVVGEIDINVGLTPLLVPLPILVGIVGIGFFCRGLWRRGSRLAICSGGSHSLERFPVNDWGGYAGRWITAMIPGEVGVLMVPRGGDTPPNPEHGPCQEKVADQGATIHIITSWGNLSAGMSPGNNFPIVITAIQRFGS